MSHDDEVCLKLGREIVRMIRDLWKTPKADVAYGRRHITFTGGEVYVLLANNRGLADTMEKAAAKAYDVKSITPDSQTN
jgi:hypothetical protein